MRFMVIVTVENWVVNELDFLILANITLLLLFLSILLFSHRRRIGSFGLPILHILIHQPISKPIVWLPAELLEILGRASSVQWVANWFVNHFEFSRWSGKLFWSLHVNVVLFLVGVWVNWVCLHFDVLFDLLGVLELLNLVNVGFVIDWGLWVLDWCSVKEFAVGQSGKFLAQFNVLWFTVMVTPPVESFADWWRKLIFHLKLSCVWTRIVDIRFLLQIWQFLCFSGFGICPPWIQLRFDFLLLFVFFLHSIRHFWTLLNACSCLGWHYLRLNEFLFWLDITLFGTLRCFHVVCDLTLTVGWLVIFLSLSHSVQHFRTICIG